MNNKCFIICDNDSTQFVIIGDKDQAETKRKELEENCKQRCIKNYGYEWGAVKFSMHYWHIHDNVPFKAYFPEDLNE